MREVYGTIRKLGATSKYKGYYFVAEAIRMTMEFQERPMKITKDIYPKLAKKFKSKPSNIEHDIRTIVNVCWENHRERLEEIAGYPLEYRPTNSEFVDMIAFYLGDEKRKQGSRRGMPEWLCWKNNGEPILTGLNFFYG
ncbi:MAG: sporulation initiation factor Spo0A C-terminal domain-containing protein [Ruminococcus sp.]